MAGTLPSGGCGLPRRVDGWVSAARAKSAQVWSGDSRKGSGPNRWRVPCKAVSVVPKSQLAPLHARLHVCRASEPRRWFTAYRTVVQGLKQPLAGGFGSLASTDIQSGQLSVAFGCVCVVLMPGWAPGMRISKLLASQHPVGISGVQPAARSCTAVANCLPPAGSGNQLHPTGLHQPALTLSHRTR